MWYRKNSPAEVIQIITHKMGIKSKYHVVELIMNGLHSLSTCAKTTDQPQIPNDTNCDTTDQARIHATPLMCLGCSLSVIFYIINGRCGYYWILSSRLKRWLYLELKLSLFSSTWYWSICSLSVLQVCRNYILKLLIRVVFPLKLFQPWYISTNLINIMIHWKKRGRY